MSSSYTASRDALLERLTHLLGEAPAHVRGREARLRTFLEQNLATPLVLFGAGNLGRKALAVLRTHGHEVQAFLDNNAALWGTSLDGVPVLSPEEGSRRFAGQGFAVVTIWRAEGGHDFMVTRKELLGRGWQLVESVIPLFWGYAEASLPHITIDLPSKVLAAHDAVVAAAGLWADERSLSNYVGQIEWRLTADFGALPAAEPDQYFADGLVSVGQDEVFVDCGAFTGDTLLDVAGRVGSWSAYHAFEPDPSSFARLQATAASLPAGLANGVRLHRAGTADRRGRAHFDATGLASASLQVSGGFEVDLVAIDDEIRDLPPTFIKMDIEGAEAAALAGAARTIRDARPLLAIAAYHRQSDVWELPLQVHELVPGYKLFLRPHAGEGFDNVLYALAPR